MRARPIAGDKATCNAVTAVRDEVIAMPRDVAALKADVANMRARIDAARGGGAALALKDGPGRMQDIELVAAAAALLAKGQSQSTAAQLREAAVGGVISQDTADALGGAHALFLQLRLSAQLIFGNSGVEAGRGDRLLLAGTDVPDFDALRALLTTKATNADAAIAQFLR